MSNETEKICLEWKTEREKHPFFGEKKTPEQIAAMWESSADNYSFERYSHIRDCVVDRLVSEGIIQGKTVADIGCGPGTYALPFSRYAGKVLAIDGSPKMLKRLEDSARSESLTNIDYILSDCRSIDPGIRCDVAFSSLCPPMNYPEALLEMECMSQVNAYVSSATIGGSIECEIWNRLGKDYSYAGYNTDFAYRFLRSLGREAEVTYFEQEHFVRETYENTVQSYMRLFGRYRPIDEELEGIICDVVFRHREGDDVIQNRSSRMGLLIWKTPSE